MDLRQRAERLRALHHGPRPLCLPNVWDVASARVVAAAGAQALATSSAAIAFTLGYPDGQVIPRAEMLDMVRRICASTSLPVTADLESGYGPGPEDAAETARLALAAGAVGLNFEDGTGRRGGPLVDLSLQVERIRALVAAGRAAGVPLVVNARVDVYIDEVGDPASRFAEAVRRGRAYREAGADCVFVPAVRDAATIGALVAEVGGPINVLAGPGTPPLAELARLGVARVSLGSGTERAAMGLVRRIAEEAFGPGTFARATEGAIPYAEMNALLGG